MSRPDDGLLTAWPGRFVARDVDCQVAELQIRIAVLNGATEPGGRQMPKGC